MFMVMREHAMQCDVVVWCVYLSFLDSNGAVAQREMIHQVSATFEQNEFIIDFGLFVGFSENEKDKEHCQMCVCVCMNVGYS